MPQPLSTCAAVRLAAVELVLSDMDGTWLGDDHSPSPGGTAAISEAAASGLAFCFATGRCPQSASDASGLDLSSRPGIYSNGAVVRGIGGAPLYALDLPSELLGSLGELAREEGICVLYNDIDDFWTPSLDAPMALHLHDDYGDPHPKQGVPSKAQLIHLVGREQELDRIEARVRSAFSGTCAVGRNLPTDLVATHPDATKGRAAARLCEALGLSRYLAIGDSGNDVSMLLAAAESGDIGVAMANARPAAMEAAEFEAAARNTDREPGVLLAVRAVAASKSSAFTN